MRFAAGPRALHALLPIALVGLLCLAASAQPLRDVEADTWVATDGLGRSLPGFDEVGPPRPDRQVGIFYFLWLGAHVNGGPWDITKILAEDPTAATNPDSPLWGPMHAFHHWGEPLFGYYVSDDAYVLRRHAQMLADAGVDVVIFDVTNKATYDRQWEALLRVWAEARADGARTPQVAFLCPFGDPESVVRHLYQTLYGPRVHPELWYLWDGKPLILADPELLGGDVGNRQQNTAARLRPGCTLGQSFRCDGAVTAVSLCAPTWETTGAAATMTLRRDGPGGGVVATERFENVADNAWLTLGLDVPAEPGAYYLELARPEGTVGWWSHSDDVFGDGSAFADGQAAAGDRVFSVRTSDAETERILGFFTFRAPQASYFIGPTKPNQWSWLEVYPQHVFRDDRGDAEQMSVGVAQNAVDGKLSRLSHPRSHGRSWHDGAPDPDSGAFVHGHNVAEQWERALAEDPRFVFVTGWNEWIAMRFTEPEMPVSIWDQYDAELSRDIEPAKGPLADHYYYQLVSYIRRYKGVRQPEPAGAPVTIDLSAGIEQWAGVTPEFLDDQGDPAHRDHPGYNDYARLTNTTGRNDIVSARVARDRENVYFLAETAEPLSPRTDPDWMVLYLDTDHNHATGWEGFDLAVNRLPRVADVASVEACTGGWSWTECGEARLAVGDRWLAVAVPRALLGLGPDDAVRLDLKWTDNAGPDGDILRFLTDGDVAPNGRFLYRFSG